MSSLLDDAPADLDEDQADAWLEWAQRRPAIVASVPTGDLDDDDVEQLAVDAAANDSLETWLAWVLPTYVGARGDESPTEAEALFAEHHRQYWEWVRAIEAGVRPEAFVGVWARGGAKSTSAELGVVAMGATGRRRYGLYVSETQDQADDHVGNIASMLESNGIARFYPAMSERLVGKFGSSKGWRRNRLRTSTGFTVDAIGLDTASRGVKLEDQRPDFIVIDDIDHHDDSPAAVARKIKALTKALIPAGAEDLAVLAIQNLVHRDGVFSRLVDGRARFLARRQVSGPVPALVGLVTEHRDDDTPGGRDVIIAGEPTWSGQPVHRCQEMIDDMGLQAFLEESQHDVRSREGSLWVTAQIHAGRSEQPETLTRVVVAVDPSGGSGPDNDAQGIVVAGRDATGSVWVLDDATVSTTPAGWGRAAVEAWRDYQADEIVAETNYGGAMVRSVIESVAATMLANREIQTMPRVAEITASRGKRVRAEPVAALYGRPDDAATWSTARVHHDGYFPDLEDEMTTWNPDTSKWSPNRVDALVWAVTHLLGLGQRKSRRRSVARTS
jgi:hypothetical protein